MAGARARRRPSPTIPTRCADRDVTGENYTESLSRQPLPKIAVPKFRDWGEILRFLLDRESAGRLSVHGRRLSVSARGRRPHAHVRGRGRARAHQPPVPLSRRRSRRRAALHRVRFDHAVRRRPGHAARHLRPHRQLRRVDRHARRHEEAVFGLRSVRADHLRVDDHQRPGADDPRHVHEHRDRSARRALPEERRALGGGAGEDRSVHRAAQDRASRRRATRASCPRATTARASRCSASPATSSSSRDVYARHQAPKR